MNLRENPEVNWTYGRPHGHPDTLAGFFLHEHGALEVALEYILCLNFPPASAPA